MSVSLTINAHVPLANFQSIPRQIAELTNDNKISEDTITTHARSHATFERIHPFSDVDGALVVD
jgi:Fic family protein